MKINNLFFILMAGVALIAFSNTALSQTAMPYPQGRFLTKDGKKVTFYILVLDGNVYKFQPKRNDSYQEVAADNIARIDKETGNQAFIWGISGAAAGFLGGLAGLAESDDELGSLGSVSSSTKTIEVAATTGICALVGALLGSGQKTYTPVYHNPNLNSGLNPNFNINVVFSNNVKGLGVRFAF